MDQNPNPELGITQIHSAAGRVTGPIGQLTEALAKAQGEIRNPGKDSSNPHMRYRYASLPGVLDAVRPALSKNGLGLMQLCETRDGGRTALVRSILSHASGEFVESEISIPVEASKGLTLVQAMGSAMTYLRRYALLGLLSIAADEDDDGASAGRTYDRDDRDDRSYTPREQAPVLPTTDNIARTRAVLKKHHLSESELSGYLAHRTWIAAGSDWTKCTPAKLASLPAAIEECLPKMTAWIAAQARPAEPSETSGYQDPL